MQKACILPSPSLAQAWGATECDAELCRTRKVIAQMEQGQEFEGVQAEMMMKQGVQQ